MKKEKKITPIYHILVLTFKTLFLDYRNVILSKTVFKNYVYGREDCANQLNPLKTDQRKHLCRAQVVLFLSKLPGLPALFLNPSSCTPTLDSSPQSPFPYHALLSSSIHMFLYPTPTLTYLLGHFLLVFFLSFFLSFHASFSLMLSPNTRNYKVSDVEQLLVIIKKNKGSYFTYVRQSPFQDFKV